MQKVIALNEDEKRVLTIRETAEKNKWWITHNLEVDILAKDTKTVLISLEPEIDSIIKGENNRLYRVEKSEKILVCTICKERAKFKIGYRFYCKKHYKHLMLTRPIRRNIIQPERNTTCPCGSGKKFKNCCIHTLEHNTRHYFNSRFAEDPKIVKSLETEVKS